MTYSIDAAIRAATREVGYRERGTNDTKFNRWLGTIGGYGAGGYGYPWCASFQGWCADKAGGRADVDYPRTAGCAVAVEWFKKRHRWSPTPHVGDWVFYGPAGATHVEMVVGVDGSTITTIGGNTAGSLDGRYYNGDGVYKKRVSRGSARIYGYGRPVYGSAPPPAAAAAPHPDEVHQEEEDMRYFGQLRDGTGAITPISVPAGSVGAIGFVCDNDLVKAPPVVLRVAYHDTKSGWHAVTVTVDSTKPKPWVAVASTVDGFSIRREDDGMVPVAWDAH